MIYATANVLTLTAAAICIAAMQRRPERQKHGVEAWRKVRAVIGPAGSLSPAKTASRGCLRSRFSSLKQRKRHTSKNGIFLPTSGPIDIRHSAIRSGYAAFKTSTCGSRVSSKVPTRDVSKFNAVNSRDNNFTPNKIARRQEQIEQSIQRYLDALETAGCKQPVEVEAKTERLREKIETLRKQMYIWIEPQNC